MAFKKQNIFLALLALGCACTSEAKRRLRVPSQEQVDYSAQLVKQRAQEFALGVSYVHAVVGHLLLWPNLLELFISTIPQGFEKYSTDTGVLPGTIKNIACHSSYACAGAVLILLGHYLGKLAPDDTEQLPDKITNN